jgi:hypothetical protein
LSGFVVCTWLSGQVDGVSGDDQLPGLAKSCLRQGSPTHGADSCDGALFDDICILMGGVDKYQQIDVCV